MGTETRIYLGDSVYAKYDGYHIVLTTDNGYGATNTIALEPDVYDALVQFKKRVDKAIKEAAK